MRPVSRWTRAALAGTAATAIAAWLMLVAGSAPAAAAAATCTFGGFGGGPGGGTTPSSPSVLGVISGLADPGSAVADPVTGRIFVTELSKNRVAIIDGRSDPSAFAISQRVAVGGFPDAVAIDPASGHVYVADQATCDIKVIDGRAATPSVIATVTLSSGPTALAFDPQGGRLFATLSDEDSVAVLGSDLSKVATLPTGKVPVALAVASGGRIIVANAGGFASGSTGGSLSVILDDASPSVAGSIAADWPHWVGVDPVTGDVYAVESGTGTLARFALAADGSLTLQASVAIDASGGASSLSLDAGIISAGREIVAADAGAKRLVVFDIAADGSLTFDSSFDGLEAGSAMAVDPQTDRLFVPETADGRVTVFLLPPAPVVVATPTPAPTTATPSASPSAAPGSASPGATITPTAGPSGSPPPTGGATASATPGASPSPAGGGPVATPSPSPAPPTAPAPKIEFVLPGPFDVSLAPADLARSASIVVLAMLLVGAPTPIFNSTLSAHQELIGRWLRRKGRRLRRRVGRPAGASDAVPVPSVAARVAALSSTWQGLALYLGVATLLYALLSHDFPFGDPLTVLVVTVASLVIGTAVSQVPSEIYVRRHYRERGKVRVALWTLGLAAGCVAITRLTGVEPGYVYGIIGGFTFTVALTPADKGRMAFRGMVVLLAVGIAAWFLRMPFQPAPGTLPDGPALIANKMLAGIFIGAIEAAAIGLIPLRFLHGEPLFRWSRVRWAVLWAIGIFFFAHVILYPVSSYEPDPSAVGLATIIASVSIYGVLALGFWWFFRRRDARKAEYLRRARLADASPAG